MNDFAPDQIERELALDPARSFICEAPAGSGKTELLTQRYLTLLALVEEPENILAITFTRKATGEMRERIVSALHMAAGEMPDAPHRQVTWRLGCAVLERDQECDWQLRHNPARLRIQTFDSLCSSLTRQLPLESSLGSQPRIIQDSTRLYQEATQALLSSFETDVPWAEDLGQLIALLENDFERFQALMVDMLQRREEWLPLVTGHEVPADPSQPNPVRDILEANLRSVISERIEAVREKIPPLKQRDLVRLLGFAAANLQRIGYQSPIVQCLDIDLAFETLPPNDPQYIPQWLGLASLLTTLKGEWRKAVNKRCGFPVGEGSEEVLKFKLRKDQLLELIDSLSSSAGLNEDLRNLRSLPDPAFDEAQWLLLRALFKVLPVLVAHLAVVFKEANGIDFPELSLAAKRALNSGGEPSRLIQRLDYRLQHILVDEFQDTSQSQVDLLNELTSGWTPGDGRTLFCVGDAMQSIYGFRGANVGLFLHCRQHGLANVPLKALSLRSNFRAQAGLVDWINRVFSAAFPRVDNISSNAVSYSPSTAVNDKLKGRAVYCHAFVDHPDNHMEARYILGIIRKTRIEQADASIAILVRSRDHASHILPLLKDAAIRFRAVEMEPLHNHAVIQDLLALTRALLHLADRTAWLAILRAPWAGLSLVDLEAIANMTAAEGDTLPVILTQCELALAQGLPSSQPADEAQGQSDFFLLEEVAQGDRRWRVLSPDGAARLGRVLPVLRQAVAERDRKTLRQWIEGAWIALGGPAVVEDETALRNASVYFDLLELWEFPSQLSSFSLLQAEVDKLYAEPDTQADDRLQIMSIHKSKGLEFDVVIVPSLQRRPATDRGSVLMWQQRLNSGGESELLMAPLARKNLSAKAGNRQPTYQYMRNEQSKKNLLENCRLLYVACTRARKRLYLSAQVKQDSRDSLHLKHPIRSSLLSTIWEPVQTRLLRVENKTDENSVLAPKAQADVRKPRALHRIRGTWRFPRLPEGGLLEDFIPRYEFENVEAEKHEAWLGVEARRVGTLVHRYLQQFAEDGLSRWSAQRIAALSERISMQLQALGVPRGDIEKASATVSAQLQAVVADDNAEFIFSSDYSFSKNEYAVTLQTGFGSSHLVMDRVFRTDDGELWIIDYKTSEPEPGIGSEEFVRQEIEKYRDKMISYRRALNDLGDGKVTIALYFSALGRLAEISVENSDGIQ